MTNDNYITIQGFMRAELGLTGNDLLVYALIYGFTQDGKCEFTGSARYIADAVGVSQATALNVLARLTDKGLLKKRTQNLCGVTINSYFATHPKNLIPTQNFSDNNSISIFKDNSNNIESNNSISIFKDNTNNIESIDTKILIPTQKIEVAPQVFMTAEQRDTLVGRYGQQTFDDYIQRISDYKLQTGRKYHDDAAALRNWVRRDMDRDRQKNQPKSIYAQNAATASALGLTGKYDEELGL